jgi:HlyD family secretion protein
MAEVLVSFNDAVKAGQVLARLDQTIFAAKVKEARANLRIAQAGVQVQQAALERAKAEFTTAQMARNVIEANQVALKAKFDETERQLQRKLALARALSYAACECPTLAAEDQKVLERLVHDLLSECPTEGPVRLPAH